MTRKKQDIAEWISASAAAAILSAKLGRSIRIDYIHRVAKRLSLPVHKIDCSHWLYLKTSIENITAIDLSARRRRQ